MRGGQGTKDLGLGVGGDTHTETKRGRWGGAGGALCGRVYLVPPAPGGPRRRPPTWSEERWSVCPLRAGDGQRTGRRQRERERREKGSRAPVREVGAGWGGAAAGTPTFPPLHPPQHQVLECPSPWPQAWGWLTLLLRRVCVCVPPPRVCVPPTPPPPATGLGGGHNTTR